MGQKKGENGLVRILRGFARRVRVHSCRNAIGFKMTSESKPPRPFFTTVSAFGLDRRNDPAFFLTRHRRKEYIQ